MGKKKKKHVQTEKERAFQEEAARKRAEKAAAAAKRRRRDAWILLAIAGVLFALTVGFTVWTVARMHCFETEFVTMKGTITGYNKHHSSLSDHATGTSYTLIISYTYEGETYQFTDTAAYQGRPDELVGNATNIYVNPHNPEQAKKVTTAASVSMVSAIAFPFAAAFYAIGMALCLQERGCLTFCKRALCIWVPAFLWCVFSVLLFWAGLPHDNFGALFSRIDGAIGYTVVAGIVLLILAADALLSRRRNSKKTL